MTDRYIDSPYALFGGGKYSGLNIFFFYNLFFLRNSFWDIIMLHLLQWVRCLSTSGSERWGSARKS